MTLRDDLRAALDRAGITQAQLADRLDVHPSQVTRLLQERTDPRLSTLERAASALGCVLTVVSDAPTMAERGPLPPWRQPAPVAPEAPAEPSGERVDWTDPDGPVALCGVRKAHGPHRWGWSGDQPREPQNRCPGPPTPAPKGGEGTEPDWYCVAAESGLPFGYCSPDNHIHSDPCGPWLRPSSEGGKT